MRRAAVLSTLATVLAVAGCGGGHAGRRAAGATATPPPAATRNHGRELVYMSRNTWDGVPEDVAVYADGTVGYRLLLHTKVSMHTRTTTLSPAALRELRGLLRHTRLAGADRVGAVAPRGRFTYLLRIRRHSIFTADGQIAAGVRPLIRRLGRLEDTMLLRGGG
jgi:hypothetical protein